MSPRANIRASKVADNVIIMEIHRDHMVSFKVSEDLFRTVERIVRERGYESRSHFIRELIERAYKSNYTPSSHSEGHTLLNSKPLTRTISMRASDEIQRMIEEMMERFQLSTKSDLLRVLIHDMLNGRLSI